ncbi:hypothetical protein A1OO_07015 [Enterovibrio norvegicus FF-33]|uniref:hypothetical protein n=1 Tax=Enterovibrio norvegicus TaxID=188144 RepID=UPI0002F0A562|nr:hypothetical protein [Enterovibrio norvegicus]OEE68785.1 hypothetical protein A1OO_07015 [Enterovibrio norvegicus FF-33]
MKVLLISPDWLNLSSPIVQEMKRIGYDSHLLDHADFIRFSYSGKIERVLSKLHNLFNKEPYKKLKTSQNTMSYLNGYLSGKDFDVVIMTSPDVFNQEHFELIKSKSKKMVAVLWDSLSKAPRNIERLQYFDKVFSFESDDCSKYGLEPITNFIKPELVRLEKPIAYEYDIFMVMTYDKVRCKYIEDILEANKNLKAKILVHSGSCKNERKIKHPMMEFITTPVLNSELVSFIERSRVILDVSYDYQKGLSFRPYEALAWEKKLVTNNDKIMQYDFYSKENFFVLGRDKKIPENFINLDFKPVSSAVREKYMLSSWIEKVLN